MTTRRSDKPATSIKTLRWCASAFTENRVQGRDDGHAQITQEGQDVTARPPAEDAIFEFSRPGPTLLIFKKSAARR